MEISFAGTSSSANAHGNGSWLTIVVVFGNVKSFTVFTKKGCCCAKRRFLAIVEVAKGATDEQVLERALSEKRVLITEDRDSGRLVYARGRSSAGVILVRFHSSARRQARDRGRSSDETRVSAYEMRLPW